MAFTPSSGTGLHKKFLKALGLEGRCVKRVVIDIEMKNVVRIVVTELADGEQIDRVIELIDSAEKREVDAQDSMILQGDPRIEEPKGVLFSTKPLKRTFEAKVGMQVRFWHPSFREDVHGEITGVEHSTKKYCIVKWGPPNARMETAGVPFVSGEPEQVEGPWPNGVCWPSLLVGMPIIFTESLRGQSPFVTLVDNATKHCDNCGADGAAGDYCNCDCMVCCSNDPPVVVSE